MGKIRLYNFTISKSRFCVRVKRKIIKLSTTINTHSEETNIEISSPLEYHTAVNDEQHRKITNDLYYEIHFDKLGLDKTILESFAFK